ncbi:MAG TPA: hypothetical protein VN428_18960 [Bryobacteraceae bacterium]|nr:hypothetical protein [Bryobacteraceae bacterium]
MNHPTEAALALYAGDELGLWPRFKVGRHVRSCDRCSRSVEEFREIRDVTLAQAADLPRSVNWDAMALEMKANIRVGLAAGACVGDAAVRYAPRWRGPALALPVLLVVIAGWILQTLPPTVKRAAPVPEQAAVMTPFTDVVLDADSESVGVASEGSTFTLRYPRAQNVLLTVRGDDAVRARYVDSETGQVTISHVYAQ